MEPLAYLVDFDGTLYRSTPVKIAMAAELACLGLSSVAVLKRFRHAHEELRGSTGHADTSPFERQILHTAEALSISKERVRSVVHEWMFDRPRKWIRRSLRHSLVAELRAAKARGCKLAIVSDYPATFKLGALTGQLEFDTVVSNGEPGGPSQLKPDPEGYLIAAARLEVPRERCLVIGDRDDADGEAARRAGIPFRLVG